MEGRSRSKRQAPGSNPGWGAALSPMSPSSRTTPSWCDGPGCLVLSQDTRVRLPLGTPPPPRRNAGPSLRSSAARFDSERGLPADAVRTTPQIVSSHPSLPPLSLFSLHLSYSSHNTRFTHTLSHERHSANAAATTRAPDSPARPRDELRLARGRSGAGKVSPHPTRRRLTGRDPRGDGSVAEHEGAFLESRVRSPVTAPSKFAECDQGLQVKTARSIGFKPRDAGASSRTSLSLSSAISRRHAPPLGIAQPGRALGSGPRDARSNRAA